MAFKTPSLSHVFLLPLLIVLHVLFIASSLTLRIYQHFQQPPPPTKPTNPPKHVALVLAPSTPSASSPLTSSTSNLSKSQSGSRRWVAEKKALVESVKRAIRWAGDEGVKELSIWDGGSGLMEECKEEIIRDIMGLPPSPPNSRPSTRRPSTSTRTSSSSSPGTLPPDMGSAPLLETENDGTEAVTTLTVVSIAGSNERPMTVHLLNPSCGDLVAGLTRSYLGSKPSEITQQRIDSDTREALHFQTDPSLLMIHNLTPPTFLRALLPRAPPQLGGYPFWSLRITEIYQHPTPLPLPRVIRTLLGPMFDRAEQSSMSLIRKFAWAVPREGDVGMYSLGSERHREVYGAMEREEWVGGMGAWHGVVQRLGK